MAATWPSIIALGATTSAPASASEAAARASSGRVASLSTDEPRRTPQWPWEVYSHRHTSAMIASSSPAARRSSPMAVCTMPSSIQAPEPSAVLGLRQAEEQHRPHAGLEQPLGFPRQLVDAEPMLARHRADLLADAGARAHEEGRHEHGAMQARLAHQAAQGRRAAQAPAAEGWAGDGRIGQDGHRVLSCEVVGDNIGQAQGGMVGGDGGDVEAGMARRVGRDGADAEGRDGSARAHGRRAKPGAPGRERSSCW